MPENSEKEHLSIVICGHVDSGKSTTTGRLIFELGGLPERELEKLKQEAERLGKGSFAFAFYMDRQKEERERGVTIACTTKEFYTEKWHYTIIDAPGHRDFIKNMITGASQADCSLIMVPADGNFTTAIAKGNHKAGEIQVLISDTALSIGINLPARTCILTGDIDETLYRQMGGRSGRRGFDNQGYVIPMFDKTMIRKCLLKEQTPVDITVPESLTMIDLIRLQTPLFLDLHASDPYTLSKKQVFPQTLKQIIMENYYLSVGDKQRSSIDKQLELIRSEKWHIHRLTNTIKHLDFSATLIFIQLLITGKLSRTKLLPVISTLFGRGKSKARCSSLVVPIKDTELRGLIKHYATMFNIDINPDEPIRDYFGDFCANGTYSVSDLDSIEKIGNWIYVLKRHVIKLAPKSDRFRQSLLALDDQYCTAVKRNAL